MARFATAALVLSLAGAGAAMTGALAQTTPPSTTTARPAPVPGPLPAPVGHRQPTRTDVPPEGQNGADAEDKALDRKIKSICRGC